MTPTERAFASGESDKDAEDEGLPDQLFPLKLSILDRDLSEGDADHTPRELDISLPMPPAPDPEEDPELSLDIGSILPQVPIDGAMPELGETLNWDFENTGYLLLDTDGTVEDDRPFDIELGSALDTNLFFEDDPERLKEPSREHEGFAALVSGGRFTPPASSLWHEERLVSGETSLSCVDCSKARWAAAGNDLHWLDEQGKTSIRCSVLGGKILSLSLLHGAAVYVTQSGALGRRHALSSQPEMLGRVPAFTAESPTRIGRQRLGEDGERLWLLSDGRLFVSDDLGGNWSSLPSLLAFSANTRVFDASSSEDQLVALAMHQGALGVFRSQSGTTPTFDVLENSLTTALFHEGAPRLASIGNLLAIANQHRVVLSIDRGRTFHPAPEVPEPTAFAAGMVDGGSSIWVAGFDRDFDEASIWQLTADAPEFRCIAKLGQGISADDDGDLASNRVRGLAWDEELLRLLVVGAFGVSSLSRPA